MCGVKAVALGVAAMLATGCGSGGTSRAPLRRDPSGSIYLVRPPDEWRLQEAYNPREPGLHSRAEPTLDWFTEYERFPDPNHSEAVRLSGHRATRATVQEEAKGFTFTPAAGAPWPASRGRSSEPNGRPSVILLTVAKDYTVMALSYELDGAALGRWSRALTPAGESEWVARGGVVER